MNTTSGNKPLIYLFSDANFLAVNILENLLSKNCYVNIICRDEKKWLERASHISGHSRFGIINKKKFNPGSSPNYAIFCQGFIKNENSFSEYKHYRKLNFLQVTKTLVLVPFERFSLKESASLNLDDNTGVIYLGDLIGPRIDLEADLLVAKCLGEILTSKSMTLGVGEKIYPLFTPDAAKTLAKWLLSFGPFGKEIFFIGPEVSAGDFWKVNESLIRGIKLQFDEEVEPRFIPKNYEVKRLTFNTRVGLSETYRHMATGGTMIPVPNIGKHIKVSKKYVPWILLGLLVFLFPIICLLGGTGFLYISFRGFTTGESSNYQNTILVAKTLFVIGKSESEILKYIPLVGRVYEESAFVLKVGEKVSGLSLIAPTLFKSSSEMFSKILGNEIYDPQPYSDEIKTSLGLVYQNTALLEADVKEGENRDLIGAKWLASKVDFEKIKNVSFQGETLVGGLPQILGKGERKTYLVLFQNNIELRPTGGFIGSFGTATFEGGRMSELNINDVYSADGQLRGHVEPPEPIKNYLGEANWWLRDSNWDPDFPTSARRAEWFLDKEVDTQVDGVMGIDLSLVRDLLKYTGPIFLPDYNLDITTNNLYEKTQAEVQENFFPGSRKKASFLTALSRSLVAEVAKLDSKNKILVLKSIFDNLEGRHIQAFLHDDLGQNAVSALGWSGEIPTPSCGEGCYTDLIGLVEANVGVNKANYFITRKVDMNVNFSSTGVKRTFTLDFQNSANIALGAAGNYKVYLRILVPGDSEVTNVRRIIGQSQESLSPEITENKGKKEIGVILLVLGGQNQKVEFSWQSPTSPEVKNYSLYVRKQAGIDSYPFALTINRGSIYNTTLDKDIWTKKFYSPRAEK